MTSNADLAVVLCHGTNHTPAPYEPFLEALKSQGIDAYCPQRPTCDLNKLNVGDVTKPDFNREPPTSGYPTDTDDVNVVVKILDKLINEEGKNVLLAAHSSGGWVMTQAAVPELQAKTRRVEGKTGGIIGLFYITAFIIPAGESLFGFLPKKDGSTIIPPFMRFHKHGINGLGTVDDAAEYFFNDLDKDVAEKWVATLTASPIMTIKLTNDPYSTLPCAYLVCENDKALAKEFQEGMIAMQNQKMEVPFTVYYAPCDHSPHLSWTAGLVERLEEFANKVKT